MSFLHFLRRPGTLNGFNLEGGFWQGPRTLLVGVGVAPFNSSRPAFFLISDPEIASLIKGGLLILGYHYCSCTWIAVLGLNASTAGILSQQ